MSFSSAAKTALARERLHDHAGKLALMRGITCASGSLIIRHEYGVGLKFSTESNSVAKLIAKLASELYGTEAELTVHENNMSIASRVLVVYFFGADAKKLIDDSEILNTDNIISGLSREHEIRSFLRGVFLGCGSVTNPEKSYHLEMVCSSQALANGIIQLCEPFGICFKQSVRKEQIIVYIKESDMIGDFLTLIGASDSTLQLESVKAYRYTRNYANRTRNCDMANINKTAAAAAAQIKAIRLLLDSGTELSESLRETAQARINNTEASLSELADILGIGKSGVNHRLKKLIEMANDIDGTEGEKI